MITIQDKKECTGCYACASICPAGCIDMTADAEGFCYPITDDKKCTYCRCCESACPVKNPVLAFDNRIAYAGYSLDIKDRLQCSSGALFSLLSQHIILTYNGIAFGAAFIDKHALIHISADNLMDLKRIYGSKYLQSTIGDAYQKAKDFLDNGRFVLFSGTPCQIAGLRAYLKKDYHNLICLDIVCHGVPSPKVWKKYILYHESKAKSSVENVVFRDKHDGWRSYCVKFNFANGKAYLENHQYDPYMKAFVKTLFSDRHAMIVNLRGFADMEISL